MVTTNPRFTPRLTRKGFIQAAPAAGCTDFADRPTAQAVPNTPIPTTSPFIYLST
jgi:hypothetical protein